MEKNSQRIRKQYSSAKETAIRYYALISSINNLELSKKELSLLSHLALGGTRKTFCEECKSSVDNTNNYMFKLYKKGVLISKDKIHPAISLDFSQPITLQIRFNGQTN